jgi:putative transposase
MGRPARYRPVATPNEPHPPGARVFWHIGWPASATSPVESMIEICREHSKNVKRWRDGTMALRWCAAGMLEADHQFRRVNGYLHLPKLRAALEERFSKKASADSHDETVTAA